MPSPTLLVQRVEELFQVKVWRVWVRLDCTEEVRGGLGVRLSALDALPSPLATCAELTRQPALPGLLVCQLIPVCLLCLLDQVLFPLDLGLFETRVFAGLQRPAVHDTVSDTTHESRVAGDLKERSANQGL